MSSIPNRPKLSTFQWCSVCVTSNHVQLPWLCLPSTDIFWHTELLEDHDVNFMCCEWCHIIGVGTVLAGPATNRYSGYNASLSILSPDFPNLVVSALIIRILLSVLSGWIKIQSQWISHCHGQLWTCEKHAGLAVMLRVLVWLAVKDTAFMNCTQLQGFPIDSCTFGWVRHIISSLSLS